MMNVLYVVSQLDIGGIECWLRDISRNFNVSRDGMKISILVDKEHTGVLEPVFCESNVKIIRVSPSSKNRMRYIFDVYRVIKCGSFDVVHSNVSYTNGVILFLAYLSRVKCRISHLHSDRRRDKLSIVKKIERYFNLALIEIFSNIKLAVSNDSLKTYLLKRKANVSPCGINVNHECINDKEFFNFDSKKSIVLGSVGRLELVKNHKFIINLMKNLPDEYKYIIVGDGSLKCELEELIDKLNLRDRVFLIGSRENILGFLKKHVNIFLFPSLSEGLGNVALEAQLANVPVIASEYVPKSIVISNQVAFCSLANEIEWINKIKYYKDADDEFILNIDPYDISIEKNCNDLYEIYSNSV